MKLVKNAASKTGMYLVMLFTIVVSLFPILWVMFSSFKTNNEIMSSPFALPSSINFDAYRYLFEKYDFLTYTTNSLIVSVVPTLVSLLFFTMGAYAIGKYNFPGKNLFYALFTITLLVPAHSRTQPIFSLIMKTGLYDNKLGLILVYLSSGMALSMFIIKASFQSIPFDITEAATIDGASYWKTFWKINLPLGRNGLVTAGVLMFLANWNEFYYANLLTTSTQNRTLPVVTILFNSMFSYNYTNTFAALTVVIVPGIIIYAFAQEQVQASLASASVKG